MTTAPCAGSAARKAGVFCTAENPKEYVALLEWDDVEKARKFINSSELREAAGWAGIGIKQDLLEEVEEVSA